MESLSARLRHDAQEDEIEMNTSRNINEIKQIHRTSSTVGRQTCKLLFLSVVNLLVGINVWAQGAPPTATTVAATGIAANSAAVYGSVNPNGLATTVYFQYGTTTAYGSTTASQSAGSGTTAVGSSASLGSLTASKTYHYRLVASNSQGTSYGADMMFTTAATTDTTAPTVPNSMTASAVSSSQINLIWSGSTDTGGSGLAGYKIYKNGVLLTTTASTSYSVTGLS